MNTPQRAENVVVQVPEELARRWRLLRCRDIWALLKLVRDLDLDAQEKNAEQNLGQRR